MAAWVLRAMLVVGVVSAAGCSALLEEGPTGPTPTPSLANWTFVISSSCSGRLNSAVSIFVDNEYQGQSRSQLTARVSVGSHEYHAFTSGREHEWGPNHFLAGSAGLELTLDCH